MKDLFLFRLNKLAAVAGQPLIRLCEGRYGITRREWRLLMTLARHGPLLSGQLADKARIEPARTSRAVTMLVNQGLAVRTPRPGDRRCVEIALTPAGRRIFDELYPTVLELNARLRAALPPDDWDRFEELFARVEAHMENWVDRAQLPKADRRRGGRTRGNPEDI